MSSGPRVLATANPVVCAHLEAPPVARAGVTWQAFATVDALVAAAQAAPPTIVIVDLDGAAGDGLAAAAALRAAPATAAVRLAVVAPAAGLTADIADALAAIGCDEVLAPPLSFPDFCTHLGRLAALSLRQDRRIEVAIAAEIGQPPLAATVGDVATGGLGLRLTAPLVPGTIVELRVQGADGLGPTSRARVAWCQATGADGLGYACGVTWDGEPALRTRLLLEQIALYDVARDGDVATVTLYGDFTELTRFDGLAAAVAGAVTITFDLAAVRYVSSAGVRAWCELLAEVGAAELRFRHCSLAFATQAAMVPMVLADGAVESLVAPYYCDGCGRDDERLLELGALIRDGVGGVAAPRLRCPRCGAAAELDDLPERYFAFLAER